MIMIAITRLLPELHICENLFLVIIMACTNLKLNYINCTVTIVGPNVVTSSRIVGLIVRHFSHHEIQSYHFYTYSHLQVLLTLWRYSCSMVIVFDLINFLFKIHIQSYHDHIHLYSLEIQYNHE